MPVFAPGAPDQKIALQDLVGGPAVLALAHDHGFRGGSPTEAVAGAAAAPRRAREFFTTLADRITVALAAVIAVLDPALVVLAGPVAREGGEVLNHAVDHGLQSVAPLESRVAITTVRDDAVLLGGLDAALGTLRETLIATLRDTVA